MSLPRLLVIDDNPDFGGHQVMAAHALDGIVATGAWDVRAFIHPDNRKNHERLQAIQQSYPSASFKVDDSCTRSRKFQAIRRHFEAKALRGLQAQIDAFQPNLILVIQGNIEQCCSIFRLQGRLPCPLVSYIPVPHLHAEMGAKLGAIRDFTCRGLYSVPDGFITISKTLGEMLVRYGARGRIQIVENGIPLEPFMNLPSKEVARAQFALPEHAFIWGQIGRIEFKQKGQDCTLNLFLERQRQCHDEQLVFLGSGPDEEALRARAAKHRNVHCLPWTNEPAALYAALDALVMPSRYEGVPLAMLEGLANGLPVVATDRDGMRDWLPATWRFPYRNMAAGLRAMEVVRHSDSNQVETLKARVREGHSLADFKEQFNQALATWL